LFFSSRRRHTRFSRDWSSDVCSSDLQTQIAALRVGDLRIVEQTNFPLLFVIFPGANLTLRLTFDPKMFDAAVVRAELAHLATMLRALCAGTTSTLGEIGMLAEDERRRIVDEWNDTDEDFGRPAVLHELVEQQAARRPDAIGVRDDSRTLTYRGLDREANRVARFLLARGLARESRVGISIDRS